MKQEESTWEPPDEFDTYRIVREHGRAKELGRGAHGRVFLATDLHLERLVAVKFLSVVEPHRVARFVREGKASARLRHPNVVMVFRISHVLGRPFIVSEYVRGQSLDQLDRPVPWRRLLPIAVGLARGLAAVHRSGVLHRDIKPANAMLSDEGEVKLLDFSLAELRGATEADDAALAPGSVAPRAPLGASPDADATSSEPAPPDPKEPAPVVVPDHRASPATLRPAAGTKVYLAPELWRDEPATPRSDLYALGALLYHLSVGRLPHEGTGDELGRAVQDVDVIPTCHAAPEIDAHFGGLIDRCLARDPSRRMRSADELREALDALAAPGRSRASPADHPYPGLRPFEAEHRGLFFGRDADISQVVELLRGESFVVVAGDSGVGKSSLCRAGVLPEIAGSALGPSSIITLTPGRHFLSDLSASLAPFAKLDEDEVATALRSDPEGLARRLSTQLSTRREGALLLFVDQLENLWTLADDDGAADEERAIVAAALSALLEGPRRFRLLVTIRGDFFMRATSLPRLGELVGRALWTLRPIDAAGLRAAVDEPLLASGFRFESASITQDLIDATGRTEGGLPLLQFALAELWDKRDTLRQVIPEAAINAIGGVEGAMARHADDTLRTLYPAARAAANGVLLRLVTAEGTRARRTAVELGTTRSEPAAAALDALVRARLVVARGGADAGSYELAHEALIRAWGTLRDLIEDDAGRRIERDRLERAAAEWQRLGRSDELLWGARRLAEAGTVLAEAALSETEKAFVAASRRRLRRGRMVRFALAIALPALAGGVWGGLRLDAQRTLDRQVSARLEDAEAAQAEARRIDGEYEAARSKAFALFDAGDDEGAEKQWHEVGPLAAGVDVADARATLALEAAVLLDPGRRDLRRRVAESLRDRAAAAERHNDLARRDDLAARLRAWDERGDLLASLQAAAHLSVESTPAGAQVSIERFEMHEGRQVSVPVRGSMPVPIADLSLAPGSYVLVFRAAGRAEVRFPVLLRAGAVERVAPALPAAEAVPEGFVYVPPGRFVWGSAGSNEVRTMLNAQPERERSTGGYLIARHEVTFGEWITYLRALPKEARAARMPFASSELIKIGLELREHPNNVFEIYFRPTAKVELRAFEGTSIRYPDRDRRAVQDWLRLPVASVSYDDAQAYAGWLASTGRVPGARLCSESEWERAARGADARVFPSGDRLAPDDADIDVTYGRKPGGFGPDEVGSHPGSRSPFGVDDMAGNVWEWVQSDRSTPMIRGGSWYNADISALSVNREAGEGTQRDAHIGLRVCAAPP